MNNLDEKTNTLNLWLRAIHPELKMDDNGICNVSCQSSELSVTECSIVQNKDDVFVTFYFPIQRYTSANELEAAMHLNIYMHETKGGALALDKEQNMIVYNYKINMKKCDEVEFGNLLNNLFEHATVLKDKLGKNTVAEASDVDSAANFRMMV